MAARFAGTQEGQVRRFPGRRRRSDRRCDHTRNRGQWVVCGGGDDAVFQQVAGLQAEDAEGFYADVLIGRSVDYGGTGWSVMALGRMSATPPLGWVICTIGISTA